MKKSLLLLLLVAIAAIGTHAATKYQINVAGVEVTSDNASRITGGDIKSGYGVYNASTNTLTLYNIYINRSGQDNYGVHNRGCDNLTIVFSGSGTVATSDNALKLERSTTIKVASAVDIYSAARIAVNLKSYNYYFTGNGELNIYTYKDAYEAIKGDGTSSTKVYFQGPKVWVKSPSRSALSSFAAYLQSGDLTIRSNGSNANVNSVSMSFSGKEAILSPYGAYYSNNTIYNSSGSVIKDQDIYISDNYVAMINSTNFPDANFRQWMLNSYSKGYITQSDVDSRTALYCNDNSISSLTGVEYFNKLIELYCHNNNLTTLRDLPSTLQTINCSSNKFSGTLNLNNHGALKSLNVSNNTGLTTLYCTGNALTSLDVSGCTALTTLNCYDNQLTSLPTLPTSVKSLAIGANKFTTLSITGRSNLQLLDVNSSNLLTSLTCSGNALTTLNVTGCSALTTLDCKSNQLTSLGTLPTSLQTIDCSSNKLSGMLSLTGRSALKSLNVSNNASLTQLYCYSNALTSLNMNSCSALTTLDCHSNQLTSFNTLPTSLQSIDCSNNKFTSLTISGRSALKTLNVSSNTSLTTLNCYSNALTSLTASGCSALTTLNCYSNALTYLNVYNCSSLTTLDCKSNQLTSFNTLPTSLQSIDCSNNKFTSLTITGRSALKTLNVSSNTSLTTLNCYSNALTSLDVSGCSALTSLYCYSNQLTSLGTLPTSLQTIDCSSNKFTSLTITGRSALKSLNVRNNTLLTTLNCYNNALTSLDYAGCHSLVDLECYRNELTALDVQGLSSMQKVNAFSNNLTSLNVQGCSSLNYLNIRANQIKESAMASLISTMRSIPASEEMGTFYVYGENYSSDKPEGNVITTAQAKAAKDKRWLPQHKVGDNWVDIPTGGLRGDLNGDGIVDVSDVNIMIDMVLGKQAVNLTTADLNGDGSVDVSDVNALIDIVLGKN